MATIQYTSRLVSTAADGVLVEAKYMKDEVQGKLQSDINADLYKRIQNLSPGGGVIYTLKGSVDSFDALPVNANPGDVYVVKDSGDSYVWTSTGEWDSLGKIINNKELEDYKTETSGKLKEITTRLDTIEGEGEGSLKKTLEDAKELSRIMVKIGKAYRKPTICLITNMDEPLGYAIGNALEVEEAINTLKGNGPSDLVEVVITLCSIIIGALKKIPNNEAKNLLFKQLNNGEAYKKFEELVSAQGGDINKLKISDKVFSIKSEKEGYINKIDAMHLGEIAKKIGAGRNTLEDKIDYEVGLVLNKKVGDFVEKDEELLKVYLKDKDISIGEILECFKIDKELKSNSKLILDIIK